MAAINRNLSEKKRLKKLNRKKQRSLPYLHLKPSLFMSNFIMQSTLCFYTVQEIMFALKHSEVVQKAIF